MQSEMKDSNTELWCGKRIKKLSWGSLVEDLLLFHSFNFFILPMVEKGKGCQMAGLWSKINALWAV